MSTTNEVWLGGERLDLDDGTELLPSFQANDRTKPDTIQSDYSPEFSVPGTQRNHRLLGQAAHAQNSEDVAYARLPAVLTSGGVEILPLALLYVKGYSEGRYQLQLVGGNRRLIDALGAKTLQDLDLARFDHIWNPTNIIAGLPYAHWQSQGWGYEVYDRGLPVDWEHLDPYTLFPSISGRLVWNQLLADAGFTADPLTADPVFAALNLPTAVPYTFPEPYRTARGLQAGFVFPRLPDDPAPGQAGTLGVRIPRGIKRQAEFAATRVPFDYTVGAPYHAPTAGATYAGSLYTADATGYYNLRIAAPIRFGCLPAPFPGEVSCKVMLYVNGAPVFDGSGNQIGKDELRVGNYTTHTFTARLERHLLQAGDTVEVQWQGDEWDGGVIPVGPTDPYWQIGPWSAVGQLPNGDLLSNEIVFSVELLESFPPGGTVRLNEWLPEMKQLDYFKSILALLGLTVQADAYLPHLFLSTGARVVANVSKARDWTAKRDAAPAPAGLPERSVAFRFGGYAKKNTFVWAEDEQVKAGYGDGTLTVADTSLPATYEMVRLPFAASEVSQTAAGVLAIANYRRTNTTIPAEYEKLTPQPRLTLRRAGTGRVVGMAGGGTTTTTMSYFADMTAVDLNLQRILGSYWPDLAAALDGSRYLVEKYRLTATDIVGLRFDTPIWDAVLGDYFVINKISEFNARRATEVELVRLNAAHLPSPTLVDQEFFAGEFAVGRGEFY